MGMGTLTCPPSSGITFWYDKHNDCQREDSGDDFGTNTVRLPGRSGFIVQAIEEKIARRKPVRWKPKTERGRRMAALLKKGRAERIPLLSDAQIEQELKERRGRRF